MTGRRSAILTYHSLDDSGSVISMPPRLFQRQMESLAEARIPVVPLSRIAQSPGAVAIAFDDGFRNVIEHAVPTLERLRMTATIFVVSGYCGGENNWPSQPPSGVPRLPLATWSELRALPPSLAIGAHTATHPYLNQLPAAACEQEFRICQDEIQQQLGRAARWLAYPYGASTPAVRQLSAQYFDLAVGTSLRFVSAADAPFDLPRIDTYYLRAGLRVASLFGAAGAAYVGVRRFLREARTQSLSHRGALL